MSETIVYDYNYVLTTPEFIWRNTMKEGKGVTRKLLTIHIAFVLTEYCFRNSGWSIIVILDKWDVVRYCLLL